MIGSIVRGVLVSLGIQAGLEAIDSSKSSKRHTVPGGAFYIVYKNNWITCERGQVRGSALAGLKELFDEGGLGKATIMRSASGKWTFSGVPAGLQQRVINIVVNG
jgi:hypothetical protein